MSNNFAIVSKLPDVNKNLLVIGIALGGNPAPTLKSFLDVNIPPGDIGQKNQFWTPIVDPAGSGYFFLQCTEKAVDDKGNFVSVVIDIHGVTSKTPLDSVGNTRLGAYTQDSGWYDNQLWKVVLNPSAQVNSVLPAISLPQFISIQSKMLNSKGTPYVIDIQGWKKGTLPIPTAHLDAFPQYSNPSHDNQLWSLSLENALSITPKITKFIPEYTLTNPAASTLGVVGTGFYPGQTLALQLTYPNSHASWTGNPGGVTQASPILAVADFAGNLDMGALMIDPGWGFPGVNANTLFEIAVFDNSAGMFYPKPLTSARASWYNATISNFPNG